MGYDLSPKNEAAGDFHFGAFSFPVLLEACGYLFSSISRGGQWYCAFGNDPRMGDTYPMILSNDGFPVTEEEAKIMARDRAQFRADSAHPARRKSRQGDGVATIVQTGRRGKVTDRCNARQEAGNVAAQNPPRLR